MPNYGHIFQFIFRYDEIMTKIFYLLKKYIVYNSFKRGDNMATYKKNKKFYIKGKYKLEDGTYKNYNKLARGASTKKEAAEIERKYLLNINDEINATGMTFKELETYYLKKMNNVIKKTSLQTTMYSFDRIKTLDNMKISLIKKETIEMIIKKMDDEGMSTSYIQKIYSVMSKVFKFAVEERLLEVNPMSRIKKFKRPNELKKEMDFWKYEEFKKFSDLFEKKEDFKFKVFFNFLYYMGCRKGEALALSWNDIDFEKSTVRINKTVAQQIKGIHFLVTPPKTRNSNRVIQMPLHLKTMLLDYYALSKELYGFSDDFFLFCGDRPFNLKTIDNRMDEYCEKAQVKRIRIHDLLLFRGK